MRNTLVVMVKEPRPGRVKTRLGAGIGMTAAAWWFRHQSASTIRRLRDRRWQLVLAVSPDVEGMKCRIWPADLPRSPQGTGSLGRRMAHQLKAPVSGPVCVVGADIPGISRASVAHAFAKLGNHDAVFGPASDGGYWLVGLKHPRRAPQTLFEGVRWSTEHALADTIATIPGLSIAFVDTLSDVDTAADLRRTQS